MQLLRAEGTLVQVGSPDDGLFLIGAGSVIGGRKRFAGSAIGSPTEIDDMLQFAAEHKIKPWIQERPMKDANQAVLDMGKNKARYRYVLVN
jgi:alcohol dehydrogenase (NADP+)